MSDWLVGPDRPGAARARLLSIARDLIATRGVDHLDIDELAARAHCSRATIYRHTGGKKHLVEAVFLDTSKRITDTVRGAVADSDGRDRARTAIGVALREIRGDRTARQFFRSRHTVAGARSAANTPAIQSIAAELIGLDPRDTAVTALAVRSFLALLLWPPDDPADEARLVDALSTALLAAAGSTSPATVFSHPPTRTDTT